jgi:hypothetical protein
MDDSQDRQDEETGWTGLKAAIEEGRKKEKRGMAGCVMSNDGRGVRCQKLI